MVSFRTEMTLSEGGLRTVRGRDPRADALNFGRGRGVDACQVTSAVWRIDRFCGRFKPPRGVQSHSGSDPTWRRTWWDTSDAVFSDAESAT